MHRRTMLALCAIQCAVFIAHSVSAVQQDREYTEVDRLRLERMALLRQVSTLQAEGDACRALLGPLRARANQEQLQREEDATVRAIEAAHPGFTVDRQSGRLVATPVPEKEPAPDGGK